MGKIVLNNVPQEIVEKYWKEMSYSFFIKNLSRNVNYWTDDELENFWKTSCLTSNSF